jgi:hypothetical protein
VDHNANLKWQTPLRDFINVNWNATVNRSMRKMSIRVIIRYCKSEVIATLFAPKGYIIDIGIA